jgi:hypothetical protein
MPSLDLRGHPGRGRGHFVIDIGGTTLAYCYIRKNACTAFKSLFVQESRHQFHEGGDVLAFMQEHHRARLPDIKSADARVCVVRDPADRVASTFRNKFIQQVGNRDIFASYQAVTGRDPQDATFTQLVTDYLQHSGPLDPHVWSQMGHLAPVFYEYAIPIQDLETEMANLIGTERAARYFGIRSNATAAATTAVVSDPANEPAGLLHNRYIRDQSMPSASSLLTPELKDALREIYAEDYAGLAGVI